MRHIEQFGLCMLAGRWLINIKAVFVSLRSIYVIPWQSWGSPYASMEMTGRPGASARISGQSGASAQ